MRKIFELAGSRCISSRRRVLDHRRQHPGRREKARAHHLGLSEGRAPIPLGGHPSTGIFRVHGEVLSPKVLPRTATISMPTAWRPSIKILNMQRNFGGETIHSKATNLHDVEVTDNCCPHSVNTSPTNHARAADAVVQTWRHGWSVRKYFQGAISCRDRPGRAKRSNPNPSATPYGCFSLRFLAMTAETTQRGSFHLSLR